MAGTEPPRIAVIIAAYNAAATLERAVRSALAQAEASEICIVDDRSTDSTAALAEQLAREDSRVRVLRMPANAGPAAARNAGLAATKAPWIAILDADDYLAPGRLAALLAHADEADFVADTLIRTTDGVEPAIELDPRPIGAISFEDFVLGNMGALRGPLDLGFVKPIFRRSFVAQHDMRYADMRLGEDYEFYARALALGARFLMLGPAGYISVEREGSLSKDHSELDLRRLRDCDRALAAVRPLTAAEQSALDRHYESVDCRLQWRRMISAVKARDPSAAFSTFTSPRSTLYLAARLGEQIWLRSVGRLVGRSAR
jgi:succinoglycan biosynthesis protein ExoU